MQGNSRCFEIYSQYINGYCSQNVEILDVKLGVA
jgi:hypothetical protein